MKSAALLLGVVLALAACDPRPPKPKTLLQEIDMKASTFFLSAVLAAAPAAAQQSADQGPSARERAGQASDQTKQAVKDSALTTKVHTALASDVGLKTLKIDVDSDANSGTVTLKGRVDSEDTKKRAEEVAKKVEGVTAVKNQLVVGASKS